MTTTSAGGSFTDFRTVRTNCLRCGSELPNPRRRSRMFCSKSCCNMASEERAERNEGGRQGEPGPFWPHGLEQDFALLGIIRQSVRSACEELWGMLRCVDADELAFRRAVESLRGRLTSPEELRNLFASAHQQTEDASAQHAREAAQLRSEKASAERLARESEERYRNLETEVAQMRAHFTQRESELERQLKERTSERDAAIEKYTYLRTENEHHKLVNDKLADSVTAIQRRLASKDTVIDVTEQLSIVDQRLRSIHDWAESRASMQDQQLQETRIEQVAESISQKLSQRLVLRVDMSAQTAQFQRLQEGVETISKQAHWLIQNQQHLQQQKPPKADVAPLLNVLRPMYEYMRIMRAEFNLGPITASLHQLAERVAPPSVDSSVLLAYLQRMENRLERALSSTPQPSNASRSQVEKITPLRQQIAALQREVKRLAPLERDIKGWQNLYGQAEQHIAKLTARQTSPVSTLDGVARLMLEKIDLQDQIAQYQEALGERVTEPALENSSPQGKAATVAQLLHEARLHILRSPRAFLEPEPCWVEHGVKLDRTSELRIEDALDSDLKRLRNLYAKLHARYHRD